MEDYWNISVWEATGVSVVNLFESFIFKVHVEREQPWEVFSYNKKVELGSGSLSTGISAKPDDLSCNPGTHMEAGEGQLIQAILWLLFT